ncbi:MAG: phage portal protein [Comamonadaceae bacterium]|nr:phage portal protein [Comamonadaceae bacterium]
MKAPYLTASGPAKSQLPTAHPAGATSPSSAPPATSKAASADRLTASGKSPSQTANEEIAAGLETTRNRSRDLFKNNEYASKFGKLVVANVVGSNGFTLQSQVVEGAQADTLARDLIEAAKPGRAMASPATAAHRQSRWQRLRLRPAPDRGRAPARAIHPRLGRRPPRHHGRGGQRPQQARRLLVEFGQDRNQRRRAVHPHARRCRSGAARLQALPARAGARHAAMRTCISGLGCSTATRPYRHAARVGALAKMGFFTAPDGDGSPLGDDKDDGRHHHRRLTGFRPTPAWNSRAGRPNTRTPTTRPS